MSNTITRTEFLKHKRDQQIHMWNAGTITTAQLVDWILGYGTDRDVEWLCKHFDPLDTIAKY